MKTSLLIAEPPLQVLPSLAVAIGLNEAIVTQQLFWLLTNPANGREHDGQRWIFNTIAEWKETYFPFWSEDTIQRIFQSLHTKAIIETCQPEGRTSRRKYYRLNEGMAAKLTTEHFPDNRKLPSSVAEDRKMPSSGRPQNAMIDDRKMPSSFNAETSSKKTTETTGNHSKAKALKTSENNGTMFRAADHADDDEPYIPPIPGATTQPELLPPAAKPDPKKKARGTIEELKAFAKSLGLLEIDGEAMFWKFEATGWMNGRTPVKNWQAVIRQWKSSGWHPSQKAPAKTNGHRHAPHERDEPATVRL